MQDRPTFDELLAAVERFLDDQVVARSEGALRYQGRVAGNVIRIVRRELAREDEQLSIRVVSPHPAPPADVRRAAADRLERIMDAAAEKAKHIPGKNVHRLLDEAIDYVRPRKKR